MQHPFFLKASNAAGYDVVLPGATRVHDQREHGLGSWLKFIVESRVGRRPSDKRGPNPPRRKLLIIGDSATLSYHPFFESLVAYVESIGAYHSVWEESA